MKKKYRVHGTVIGGKYLGEFEATTPEEAVEMAIEKNGHVSLCYHCSSECEDPEIDSANAEEITDEQD